MNRSIYTIEENVRLTPGRSMPLSVWKMVLCGDTSHITAPGQFVNIGLPGKFLRRPVSICDWDSGSITIVYRVVGDGTLDLSSMSPGDRLDMLAGLGNGFSTDGDRPLLIGGGVGLPPMFSLAAEFVAQGKCPQVVAGFASEREVILLDEFRSIGIDLIICTMDGSSGIRGTVLEAIKNLDFDKFYACGPKPMLKALAALKQPGELSVEERMGCGYGVCMGCSCRTGSGMKRVCREGPVFDKEDLIW